jgi:predicted dehydrogenase
MRFALLGNHPDGLAMARALCAGGHELVICQASAAPDFAPAARLHSDLEEVLAEPALDLVIVASSISVRPEHLRRALQSEHDVLCVHPCAVKPDPAYEASMIQGETGRLLMPLLPLALHPVFARLRELLDRDRAESEGGAAPLRLLQWERFTRDTLEKEDFAPPWDVLRRIGGEIVEVSALAACQELDPHRPTAVSGLFTDGGLFQATLLAGMTQDRVRLEIRGTRLTAEIDGPDASGTARMRWCRGEGAWHDETWPAVECWRLLAQRVADARAAVAEMREPLWQDEVRALELDDALRRSIEKRRTSGLEYQEISEEVATKSTLTLIGCGVIWLILLVLVVSIWWPWIRWAIVPLLLLFLSLWGVNLLGREPKVKDPTQSNRPEF